MENTSCSSADAPTATRPVIFSGSRTCPGSWEVPTWAWRFPGWACSLLLISRPTRSRDLAIGPRTRSRPPFKRELYRVPEIVTLGRLPGEGESDSRWRTKEVRHVGSDTLTP